MPQTLRLGAPQRANQRRGRPFAERIDAKRTPVEPQQQARKVQYEVNQSHESDK
jgi:hypothetical protein